MIWELDASSTFQYASTMLLLCCCSTGHDSEALQVHVCGAWDFPRCLCYYPTTTMKIWLRLVYAYGDAAATLLRHMRLSYAFVLLWYPFYIKSEVQLIYMYVQLNVNIQRKWITYLSRNASATDLLCWMMRRRRRAKNFWVDLWLSAGRRLQFGHYDQIIRKLRKEDGSLFFNYTRIEPLMFDVSWS